jgi:hypothetical protein
LFLRLFRNAWQGLQKQVPVTRAAIAPQVKVQAAKTKVDIGVYEQDVAAYQDAFRALEFWQYSAGPEGARRLIDECEVSVSECHRNKDPPDIEIDFFFSLVIFFPQFFFFFPVRFCSFLFVSVRFYCVHYLLGCPQKETGGDRSQATFGQHV